jgi:hypothetical protein
MSMTNDVQKVLPAFFAEAGGVIGAEKTYHALFTHHLFAAGAPLGAVGREVGLNGRAKVDVVLFDPAARGDFARTDLARVAIEFKGGAYGNRNALRDTVRPGRPIDDLEKLAALPGKSLERWFLCIDLPSLGRALTRTGWWRWPRQPRPGVCISPTTVRAIRRSPCGRRVANCAACRCRPHRPERPTRAASRRCSPRRGRCASG